MSKILIIDDDKAICQMLVRLFENSGTTVSCAFTLSDGLKLLRTVLTGFDPVTGKVSELQFFFIVYGEMTNKVFSYLLLNSCTKNKKLRRGKWVAGIVSFGNNMINIFCSCDLFLKCKFFPVSN